MQQFHDLWKLQQNAQLVDQIISRSRKATIRL